MSKQIDINLVCRARFIDTCSFEGESADVINEVLADYDTDEIEGVFQTIFAEGEESLELRGKEVEGFRAGQHVAFGDDIFIYLGEDGEDAAAEGIDSSFEFECRQEDSSKNVRNYPFGLNIPENFKINFEDSKVWAEKTAKPIIEKYKDGQEEDIVDELVDEMQKKLLMPFYNNGLCLYTVEKQRCQLKATIELEDDEDFDIEKLKLAYCCDEYPSTTNDDDEEIGVPAIYEGEFALRTLFYKNKAYDLEIIDADGSGASNYATNDIFEGNVIYES